MKITREMVKACRESMGKGWNADGGTLPAFSAIGWLANLPGAENYFWNADEIELAIAWIVTIGPCDLGD